MWQNINLNFFNIVLNWLPIVIAGVVWLFTASYFFINKNLPKAKIIWLLVLGLIIFIFFEGIFSSVSQYYIWKKGGASQFFLPPHISINYFLGYSFYHFFLNNVIAIVFSLFFGFLFWFLNRDYENRFMNAEEIPLIILGGLIVGWPNFVLYIFLALFTGIFGWLYARLIKKESVVNLTLFFLISAGLVLFFGKLLWPLLMIDKLIV